MRTHTLCAMVTDLHAETVSALSLRLYGCLHGPCHIRLTHPHVQLEAGIHLDGHGHRLLGHSHSEQLLSRRDKRVGGDGGCFLLLAATQKEGGFLLMRLPNQLFQKQQCSFIHRRGDRMEVL